MTRTLILTPTALERDILVPLLETALGADDRVELCGFGLVAAAAVTSQLIERLQPDRLVLAGIAGTFSDALPIGRAATFDEVACFGIGAGSGPDHQTVGDMGWHHVGGRQPAADPEAMIVSDTISIGRSAALDDDEQRQPCQLLSVAAACGNAGDVSARLRRFPQASAEDMEGFAVAMVCCLAERPLTIVRGISNQAGDRDLSNWQVESALQAAASVVKRLLLPDKNPSLD